MRRHGDDNVQFDNLVGDQVTVRHDDFGALEGGDSASASADSLHRADQSIYFDGVLDADGSLEEQDKPRCEVVHDVLQAKTDADAYRTGDNGELVQLHAGVRDGNAQHEHQQKVVSYFRDGIGQAPLHGKLGDQDASQQGTEASRQAEANHQNEQDSKGSANGEMNFPHSEGVRENVRDRVRHPFAEHECVQVGARTPDKRNTKNQDSPSPKFDVRPNLAREGACRLAV